MKIVTLNIWGGRIKEPLKGFLEKNNKIDIWSFQEVYRDVYHPEKGDTINRSEVDFNAYQKLEGLLNNHQGEFCQVLKDIYGIATFVKKDIRIIEKGETLVARGDYENLSDPQNRDHHRKLFWIEVEIKGKKVLIANVHLTHRPEGKADSDKRIKQSKMIVEFLSMFDCPKILVGDFNLMPDTESIRILEDAGLINLIKKYNITSTRTELYKKQWKFADYIFVSPEIKVNSFEVLPDVVSDHSPLVLDFDL